MSGLRTALSCAFLMACAPVTNGPGAPPPTPGVYPRAEAPPPAMGSGWGAVREEWSGSAPVVGRLRGDAALPVVLAALPAPGSPVPVRTVTWPSPVHVSDVSDAGFAVRGGWVDADALGAETRCQGSGGGPVRLVVHVGETGGYVDVEARLEWAHPAGCEVSTQGTKRLQRAAMDVYLWVRNLARTGPG